jgi:hypothetical protein
MAAEVSERDWDDLCDRVEALESNLQSINRALDLFNSMHSKLAAEESLAADHTPKAKPLATDRELGKIYDETPQFIPALRAIYDLGREHGAAQATCPHIRSSDEGTSYCALGELTANRESTANDCQISSSTSDGGLVERVAAAITPNDAIRHVADWLDRQQDVLNESWAKTCSSCAELLRWEADQ